MFFRFFCMPPANIFMATVPTPFARTALTRGSISGPSEWLYMIRTTCGKSDFKACSSVSLALWVENPVNLTLPSFFS